MINKLIVAIIILTILACATVSAPYGGEKDTKEPQLISSSPADQTINYTGNEINMLFSEWIKVEQLEKELIITPKTDLKYEYTTKKESLKITFKSKLQDSTTYTLNFRNAIKDITEGNIWKNPVIAFSTGSYLDSMTVKGRVINIFTKQAAKDYLVGLYPTTSDTSNLREGFPLYFTTTNDEGNFQLQNIKIDEYFVYVFNDKNDNLINNSSEESFGFYPKVLEVKDSVPDLLIESYFSNEDTLKIKNAGPSGKDFKISFNKPIYQYTIYSKKDSSQYIYSALENENKELRVFIENYSETTDSIPVSLTLIDSVGNQLDELIYLKFRESKIKIDPIKVTKKPNTEIKDKDQHFEIGFSKPIHSINYDSIMINLGDSIKFSTIHSKQLEINEKRNLIIINTHLLKNQIDSATAFHVSNIQKRDSMNSNKIDSISANDIMKGKLGLPSLKPKLLLKKGALIGIEKDTVATLTYPISFVNIEDFGTIQGSIINGRGNYIVELTTEDNTVIDTLYTKNNYEFSFVKPSKYKIRIIEDINDNRMWDVGEPISLKPAENIYSHPEIITVKANWEIQEIDFEL